MDPTATETWTAWTERGDERAFARLVRPAIPHALAAARRTGLDADSAEDIVQDCLVSLARERGPRPARIGIVPWLVRAATLGARTALRSRARRLRRESLAVPPAPTAPDRIECRDEVERALACLSEEERELVCLRYLHDLDYTEVGTIVRASPGACRVRVHRALERLRARLGNHTGARIAALGLPAAPAANSLVASALAGAAPGGGATVPLLGALAMKTATMVTLATIVLLAAAVVIVGIGVRGPDPSPEIERLENHVRELERENEALVARASRSRNTEARARDGTAGPEPSDPAASEELATLRRELAQARERLAAVMSDRPVDGKAPTPAGDVFIGARLRVRVVDEHDRPLAGVRVGTRFEQRLEARTDDEGVAVLPRLVPGVHGVYLRSEGITNDVRVRVPASGEVEQRVVVPSGSAVLTGLVSDRNTGPIEGARVALYRHGGRDAPGTQRFEGETGPDGRYRVEGLPPGRYNVIASWSEDGRRRSVMQPVEVPETGIAVRDLTAGIPSLSGRITDAATGRPIAGARVSWRGVPARSEETGPDGTYELLDLMEGKGSLMVSLDGYGIEFRNPEVTGVGQRLDLALRPAAPLRVTIRAPDGTPCVGRVGLSVRPRVEGEGTRVGTSIRTDEAGRGRYDQIVPGAYELLFHVSGLGKVSRELILPPEGATIEVTLERE